MNKKVVLLAGSQSDTNIIYNALKNQFEILHVIIEKPVARSVFWKRRVKKLGIVKVLGQILFGLVVIPILVKVSKKRIAKLKQLYNFDESDINMNKVINVESVNDDTTLSILKKINPDIVVVSGTRIIAKNILNSINGKFINIHSGITPLYRGVHGGYWALTQNDAMNCGVTVHLVDAGVDTGGILYQALITPGERDNFLTYPILQLHAGLLLLSKAISDLLEHEYQIRKPPTGISKMWTHPTLWEYLMFRLKKGVK